MDEIIATINYLIREKCWCSIRTYIDKVSLIQPLTNGRNYKKDKTRNLPSGKHLVFSTRVV
jgi:hypothetical protein